eukprot:COSAG02_NODE_98_length_37150_cov_39.614207_1_plen_246_part_00
MAVSESRQLLKTLVSAALVVLCTSPVAVKARIRNDGVDELFVEYEDDELPENETYSGEEQDWGAYDGHDGLDLFGFDMEPCLAMGCTEEMLTNDQCDEPCNHAACDYDMTLCFKFFDIHGCVWTFLSRFVSALGVSADCATRVKSQTVGTLRVAKAPGVVVNSCTTRYAIQSAIMSCVTGTIGDAPLWMNTSCMTELATGGIMTCLCATTQAAPSRCSSTLSATRSAILNNVTSITTCVRTCLWR